MVGGLVMGIASAAVRNKHRADPEVREARQRGHELFDQLWQEGGWSRTDARAAPARPEPPGRWSFRLVGRYYLDYPTGGSRC